MKGWAALRKERLPRLRELGLIDDAWPLSSIDPGAADWEKVKDMIDSMIDMMLNYRQSGHP